MAVSICLFICHLTSYPPYLHNCSSPSVTALFLLIRLHNVSVTWSCLIFCPTFYPASRAVRGCCCWSAPVCSVLALPPVISTSLWQSVSYCLLRLQKDFLLHLLETYPFTLLQITCVFVILPTSHRWASLAVLSSSFSLRPLYQPCCTLPHHLIFSTTSLWLAWQPCLCQIVLPQLSLQPAFIASTYWHIYGLLSCLIYC